MPGQDTTLFTAPENKCVRCGKDAIYKVEIIRASEALLETDASVTLAGIKTTQRFIFGPPQAETVYACSSCRKYHRWKIQAITASVALFLFVLLTTVLGISGMAILSTFGDSIGISQQQGLVPCFATGSVITVSIFAILFIWHKTLSAAGKDETTAAHLACAVLNKKYRGEGIRYFTCEQYKQMIETGKHPESE